MRTKNLIPLALVAACLAVGCDKASKPSGEAKEEKKPEPEAGPVAMEPAREVARERVEPAPDSPDERGCNSQMRNMWNTCVVAVKERGAKAKMPNANIGALCSSGSIVVGRGEVTITDTLTVERKPTYADKDFRVWTCKLKLKAGVWLVASVQIRRPKSGEL
jgi:hypothetical protein